jgi:hypothetical protein
MGQENTRHNESFGSDLFIPMFIVALTLLFMAGFQTSQLLRQGESLRTLKSGQDSPLEDSRKVRTQFDSITTGAAQLADQGNPHAKMLLKELRKLGVTVTLPNYSTE